MKPLLDKSENGGVGPSFVISRRVPIDWAHMYKMFRGEALIAGIKGSTPPSPGPSAD